LNRIAERTKLITFNSDIPQSRRLLYVGTNHYEVGKALGLRIAKLLPKGGKMAVFLGTLASDSDQERFNGMKDVVSRRRIEIVEQRADGGDLAKARSNVEETLKARDDIDVVAGLSSHNGPAIAAALTALHKKGKVKAVAFDEREGTLEAIRNGTIAATVVQEPFEIGYLTSKWLHELATKPKEAITDFPEKRTSPFNYSRQVMRNGIWTKIELLDRGNLAEFERKRAEKKDESGR
jgi:ribose transport system substrate-binding protein